MHKRILVIPGLRIKVEEDPLIGNSLERLIELMRKMQGLHLPLPHCHIEGSQTFRIFGIRVRPLLNQKHSANLALVAPAEIHHQHMQRSVAIQIPVHGYPQLGGAENVLSLLPILLEDHPHVVEINLLTNRIYSLIRKASSQLKQYFY